MRARLPILGLVAATLAVAGCDEGLPTAASRVLDVVFSAVPDPAVAQPSSGVTYVDDNGVMQEYDWEASIALLLRTEQDQPNATIVNIGLNVQEAVEGIAVSPAVGEKVYYRFIPRATTNRLLAGEEVAITFDVWYALPGENTEALVAMNATLQADAGFTVTEAVQVSVQP